VIGVIATNRVIIISENSDSPRKTVITYGKHTQFRHVPYFVVQHSKFTTNLGMCSILSFNISLRNVTSENWVGLPIKRSSRDLLCIPTILLLCGRYSP
jgi:hypothetical protein